MLSKILIIREFKIAKNRFNEVILSIISCLITVCIFLLILDANISDPRILYGFILMITTFNILINDYLSEEFRAGVIEQLLLLPISPFSIILIKFCFNTIKYIFIHIILWYLISNLVEIEFYYLEYIIFTINLMSISLLVMTISICLPQRQHIISSILLMPLVFPQIILSILSVYDSNYIYLSLSLTVIMLPIFIIFSTIAMTNAIAANY